MTDSAEALRLADALGNLEATGWGGDCFALTDYSEKQAELAAAELRRLVAENEALRADAERYRWLRENSYLWPSEDAIYSDQQVEAVALWHTKAMTEEDIDAAIDAARSMK